MPLRLEIRKLLATRSERVKSCDLHPTEPWVLAALYSGHLFIWNYATQTVLKSIEVGTLPIRCAKLITRKQWAICGSDDMMIRVFNINTMEKIAAFEAHMDYIRFLEVHPTQPFVLSSSDDMQIKLWNWDMNWSCQQIFEGHGHYVMQCKWSPKDSNTFASASLDKTIKFWSIASPIPNYSLEGHEKGVNCVSFYEGGDKPYLVSGADDSMVKIWDYQTKSCVQTLDGHIANVSAVEFHPILPLILSASEDGTVRMWHNTTYRLEATLNYGLERCWALAVTPESSRVAIGYDNGTIVIGLGQDEPVCSMDASGKLLMSNGKSNDIIMCSLRGISATNIHDGDPVETQTKDLGSCELFPQKLMHNSNGRFVAICGDGEFIIYTATALRNKSFGSALDFCWSSEGTGDYAVRESTSRLRIFKNFKETKVFKPPFSCESIFGGNLICLASSGMAIFVDWVECRLIMRIDVPSPKNVYWSPDGENVVLACEDSFFVLRCHLDLVGEAIARGNANSENGVDGSFTLLHEFGEIVESGQWVSGCFLYTNSAGRLNYYVGGEVMTLAHLDHQFFLLGFVAKENRVFLIDKNRVITSYSLLESVLQYQTAVVRRDFELANELLAIIPHDRYNDVSRFLESQGFKEVALMVANDPDQKFDLALQLEKVDTALDIMRENIMPNAMASSANGSVDDDPEVQERWKQLGDLALTKGNIELAKECAKNADDMGGLLLMYTSSGDSAEMQALISRAMKKHSNIAFLGYFLRGDLIGCIDVLQKAGRYAEAAIFARTYAPSQTMSCTENWKTDLAKTNPQASAAIADPINNPEMFGDFSEALRLESLAVSLRSGKACPGTAYPTTSATVGSVLFDVAKEHGLDAVTALFEPYTLTKSSKVSSTPKSPILETFDEPDSVEDMLGFEEQAPTLQAHDDAGFLFGATIPETKEQMHHESNEARVIDSKTAEPVVMSSSDEDISIDEDLNDEDLNDEDLDDDVDCEDDDGDDDDENFVEWN